MKRRNIIITFLGVALLAIGAFFIFSSPQKENQVCLKNYCFEVELALTAQDQAMGLMFREKLGQNEGMLFVFQDEANRSFWMKNTMIPLDIIWLNEDKEVVFISKNTQPCRVDSCPLISPNEPAKYVLELNEGVADKIGLNVGDKMDF